MTIVKNSKEEGDAVFNCITQEAERQRVKHPEHVDAIDAAERRTRTRVLERLWAPKIAPRTLHNAVQFALK
jgi:hypothetical protein